MQRLIMLALLLTGCATEKWAKQSLYKVSSEEVAELEARLITRKLDQSGYTDEGYIKPHTLSYIIQDYMDMKEYEIVKEKCDEAIESMLIGGYDEIRKRNMRGVLSKSYTEGKSYFWILHTGDVLLGCLEYANMFNDLDMINASDFIMKSFDEDFDGIAYYEPYLGYYSPYNMQADAAMALEFIGGYTDRVDAIAQFQKDAFYPQLKHGKKYLMWKYSVGTKRVEDTGHAIADLNFMAYMYEQGRVFTKFDIERAMATYEQLGVANSSDTLYSLINGSGGYERPVKDVCSYAIPFFKYSSRLFNICKGI